MRKKYMLVVVVILLFITGGLVMNFKKNDTISIEQQNNIVRRIARSYENIDEINFLKFYQNKKTGSYGINFILNNDKTLSSGISFRMYDDLNKSEGFVGLNPVSVFGESNPNNNPSDLEIDISQIKIVYLKESR